jgi:hypothetical protein
MAIRGVSSDPVVHVLWINAGLSCDGDSVSLTNAKNPSVEDLVLGVIPGLPKVQFHWPLIDYTTGDEFIQWFWKAARGELEVGRDRRRKDDRLRLGVLEHPLDLRRSGGRRAAGKPLDPLGVCIADPAQGRLVGLLQDSHVVGSPVAEADKRHAHGGPHATSS